MQNLHHAYIYLMLYIYMYIDIATLKGYHCLFICLPYSCKFMHRRLYRGGCPLLKKIFKNLGESYSIN